MSARARCGHRSATSSVGVEVQYMQVDTAFAGTANLASGIGNRPTGTYHREGHRHNVGDGPRSTNLVARGSVPARHAARSLTNTCERALTSIPHAVPPCPAAPPRPGATCGGGNRDHTLAASRRGADTDRLSRRPAAKTGWRHIRLGRRPMRFNRHSLWAIVGGILFGALAANAQSTSTHKHRHSADKSPRPRKPRWKASWSTSSARARPSPPRW